ncbi:isocitrate lyase/phosphoenolpyruvate mutase family protein [Thalassobaculum sp. OXR-137]|uniref:isocitrate lyase/PEP mutase family protein n=1 Tax=Thalassobaculum sp. OXR-137 TaxID=3100173 RepID=UPI002AC9A50A|nr:isocitrate lyase/phosphoenolpyruvate mutase family protein [Thalassobaculum sp. OXR-137]WPZ33092.1 isocitrate lyase/phosphoenolpyruvate mutase family protein [Thalassobaculum sp. OXR-137]
MTETTERMRALLKGDGIVLAPGCWDALTGLLVEQAGFDAAYVSGASIAYSRLGRPDIGLMGLREIADTLTAIRERISIPMIVDGDNGHGNALSVQRTVREYERAGADVIQLEDQSLPKRCGHLKGKGLVSADEMVGKLHAALDARRDALIMARTDAIAVEGFEAALDRAERYVEAGVDLLFVEAPENDDQIAEISRRFAGRVPLLANMVEGGATPIRSTQQMAEHGFKVVIFPGGTARAMVPTLQGYFASLKEHGTTAPWRDRMLDLTGLNDVLGTPEMLAEGAKYDAATVAQNATRKGTGTDGDD